VTRAAKVEYELAVSHLGHAVEDHRLEAHVVEEVLDVDEPARRRRDVGVQRRRAVRGQRDTRRVAQCIALEKAGVAEAARRVDLLDVDRVGVQHAAHVHRVVGVLAGGDRQRRAIADEAEAVQVVG